MRASQARDHGREGVAGLDGAIDDHEFSRQGGRRLAADLPRVVDHCSQTARDLEVLDPVLRILNMNTLSAVGAQRHSRSTFMTHSCYALS